MNDEEMLSLEELEQDIETLQEFLKKEEPKAAELDEPKEPESAAEPEIVVEAPKPKPKAKSKLKAKKAEEEVIKPAPAPAPVQVKTEAPTRLYGAARLRVKRGL
jgi:outer membrane biosynthesis protein TonB